MPRRSCASSFSSFSAPYHQERQIIQLSRWSQKPGPLQQLGVDHRRMTDETTDNVLPDTPLTPCFHFRLAISAAQAFATPELGAVLPGIVAQPAFSTNGPRS